MPVWMSHPKHGRTPAVGAEVEWNRKNGWTVDAVVKAAPVPAPVAETAPVSEPSAPEVPSFAGAAVASDTVGLSDDIRTQYVAKFGKPPHHRMTDETIKARLAE